MSGHSRPIPTTLPTSVAYSATYAMIDPRPEYREMLKARAWLEGIREKRRSHEAWEWARSPEFAA